MPTKRIPPGPFAYPLLGNLLEVRRDPLRFLTNCARSYGDITRYQILRFPVYLFSHPDDIENILVTQAHNFKKGRIAQASRSLFGNGLLLSEGTYWRRQRHLMQPALAKKRISSYAPLVVQLTQRMLASWQEGETINIQAEMIGLTMQIIAQALFGAQLDQEVREARAALNVFLQNFRTRVNFGMTLPERLPTPGNRRLYKAIRSLDEIIFDIIQQRRRNPNERDDLLAILLNARDEDGNPMTDRQLRDEVLTLFIGGHETTATALTWAFYLLASHQLVEDRLVEELNNTLGGRIPKVDDMLQLTYTEKIVKETLRLFPPAWGLSRLALQDCEVGGYTIPASASVVVSQWVVQRDPRFFPRPEEFLPERWTDEFEQNLPRFAYFPFGGGPRVCIGSFFALQEAVLVLACVAQRAHLRLVAGQKVEPWATLVLRPKNTISLNIETLHGDNTRTLQKNKF
jgi:cytochrome P450